MTRKSRRVRRGASRGTERLHGLHVIEEALRARRRTLHRLLIRRGVSRPELEPVVRAAREAAVPVHQADPEQLLELADGVEANLQGALLEAGPLPQWRGIRELCLASSSRKGGRRVVILDGVEDPQNVGAIARVAEAAGASGLVLSNRRAPPLSPALARASSGAIEWLSVARVSNLARALSELKEEGFWLLGADPGGDKSLFELPDRLLCGDVGLVLGSEGRGLRPSISRQLDHPFRIPMQGRVASLNVATAGAVVLFELLRRSG